MQRKCSSSGPLSKMTKSLLESRASCGKQRTSRTSSLKVSMPRALPRMGLLGSSATAKQPSIARHASSTTFTNLTQMGRESRYQLALRLPGQANASTSSQWTNA